MDSSIKEKLDKLVGIIQTKFEEDYINEFCQEIFSYMIENENVNKKLYACQYLKETFITNSNNETNDVYDKLSWGLMPVLTSGIQYSDTTVDSQTKNDTNALAIELLNHFLTVSSPKEMLMVYSEGISNLSEINAFNNVNEIENETLLFNQLYQYINITKAILNAMTLIKTKNRHLFLKNVLNILKKGLNSVALLSRRYNQYFFDKINNENTQNDELYRETEKNLLNELIEFNFYAMDTFLAILKDEVEKIPESLRSSQYNIGNAITRPKTEAEIEYYLSIYYLFELCHYGLSYTFIGSPKDFSRLNPNKYRSIIDNYKLKDYLLEKWFSKLITVASDLHLDISKLFYINNSEKYDLSLMDTNLDGREIYHKFPFSLEGRSVLLSAFFTLPMERSCFNPIDDLPDHQWDSLIQQFFPKVLHPSYTLFGSLDYLNALMILNQDIGLVSHVLSSFDYLKSTTPKESVNLKDLKNVNDINSINLLSILKTYVSLMVTVPYAIIRDRMYLLLKEFVSRLTEQARFTFIMEVIQNSYTESIVVLGIVLYKDAIHEAWMEEVYGNSEMNHQNKKSIYFSTEFLDIIKKTLFNLKSPIYESFNTDLKFLSNDDEGDDNHKNDDTKDEMKMKVNEKEEENNKENKENEIEGYLDIYEGFWKKFEILFQSLNLYSYLFLRDNKEKVIQIWNNNFNDEVERDFLRPLKAKVQKWQRYIQKQEQEQAQAQIQVQTSEDVQEHEEEHEEHPHHHHHHHPHSHGPPTANPYSYIPDCPEFQLVMMENMIEQLFSLRNEFNRTSES
ncbi:hypothetical protein LY90DRAFT_668448 [Neocallimastix californiae]|uniref:Uncharacterized protein n=1 Tax=Neocallimastix californiae TaxID=1754190 RepID=A0A1Y2DSB8_9FUNG|nr:hypothetical protein LY90DRAFT_668448 [Neocallimastix californiae]|eukprot:ORY62044.1 hypothetical protein LY90DRAFT_668448 [Neocallimastix californiae]